MAESSRQNRIRKGLLDMPQELWLIIRFYLSILSTTNLAFICRRSREILGNDAGYDLRMRSNFYERLQYLETMEKAMHNYVLCPYCAIYHRRETGHGLRKNQLLSIPSRYMAPNGLDPHDEFHVPQYRWAIEKCRADEPRFHFLTGDRWNWSTVHLILRQHRLGAKYGISNYCRLPKWKNHQGWEVVFTFRVHENRLLFLQQAYYPFLGATTPWPDFSSIPNMTCGHVGIASGVYEDLCTTLDRYLPPLQTLGRTLCRYCPTQYCIEAGTTNLLVGHHVPVQVSRAIRSPWVLRLGRYVDFGELKPSDVFEWESLADIYAHQNFDWPSGMLSPEERWDLAMPLRDAYRLAL